MAIHRFLLGLLVAFLFHLEAGAMAAPVTTTPKRPIKVILDTDIGTDFDDTFALFFMLSRRDIFDVCLVQCSTFNTTKRAQIVANILRTTGRMDVPIGVGAYTGDDQMPQYSIAANYSLADFVADGGKLHSDGVAYMEELMGSASAEDPVHIVEIAPATSLGAVLKRNASFGKNVIVTAMSGSVAVCYDNITGSCVEYNVQTDIPSSMLVYGNKFWLEPLMTAPLDTTIFMQFNDPEYQTLLAANASTNTFVFELLRNYEAWYFGGGRYYFAMKPFSPSTGTSTLYDLQASYMAAQRVGWFPRPLIIETRHHLIVNRSGFTAISATGEVVLSATSFATGRSMPYPDVDSIAADVVASLINPSNV